MSPTPRAVAALGAIALAALVVPPLLAVLAAVALAVAVVVDALAVREPPRLERSVPNVLSRGVPAAVRVEPVGERAGHLRLRQPATPDLAVENRESDGVLEATVVPRRRGRHELPAVATRGEGPHHMTYIVADVRRAVERARAAGLRVVDEDYRDARWQEAFISPRSAFGTIIQLAQTSLKPEERERHWSVADAPHL